MEKIVRSLSNFTLRGKGQQYSTYMSNNYNIHS
jgi:hypothetical protein